MYPWYSPFAFVYVSLEQLRHVVKNVVQAGKSQTSLLSYRTQTSLLDKNSNQSAQLQNSNQSAQLQNSNQSAR